MVIPRYIIHKNTMYAIWLVEITHPLQEWIAYSCAYSCDCEQLLLKHNAQGKKTSLTPFPPHSYFTPLKSAFPSYLCSQSQDTIDLDKVCLFVCLFVCSFVYLLVYSVALRHHYVDFELYAWTWSKVKNGSVPKCVHRYPLYLLLLCAKNKQIIKFQ